MDKKHLQLVPLPLRLIEGEPVATRFKPSAEEIHNAAKGHRDRQMHHLAVTTFWPNEPVPGTYAFRCYPTEPELVVLVSPDDNAAIRRGQLVVSAEQAKQRYPHTYIRRMGLVSDWPDRSLTLLPISGQNCSLAVLPCEREDDLFDYIEVIEKHCGVEVEPGFESHMGDCQGPKAFGPTSSDGIGIALRHVSNAELLEASAELGVQKSNCNRAAWSYLAALPVGTRIALYWH